MTGRIRRRHIAATVGAVTLSLVFATSVAAAVAWSPAVNLRNAEFIGLEDAEMSGDMVAVAWSEQGSTGPVRVGVKVSTNAGSSFGAPVLFERARAAALAFCDGQVNVVFSKQTAPGERAIMRAVLDGSGGQTTSPVADGPGRRILSDVACTDGRIFVGWEHQDALGGDVATLLSHALLSDGEFGSPMTLSVVDEGMGLALTASPNAAYAAFGRSDGHLRVKRFNVGSGPDFTVSGEAADVVSPGSERDPAYSPEIDVDGSNLAVAFGRCGGTYARVSEDGAQTWGPVQKIRHIPCDVIAEGGTGVESIAVEGDRIALVVISVFIPDTEISSLVRTRNGFQTTRDEEIGDHQSHQVGYVTVNGEVKLGDAFSKHFDVLKFRRQS